MTIDIRRTAPPRIALGICLVLAGVGLTLESLHVVPAGRILQYWPLGLVILGASVVFEGSQSRGESAPAAASVAGAWPIVAVICGFFVLSQAFEHRADASAAKAPDGGIRLYAVMGGSHGVSHAAKFSGGTITSVMGGSELDLRHATIAAGDEAVIDVDILMGGAVIRVPDGWTVDVHALSVLGGIDDQRGERGARTSAAADTPPNTPRLVLRGHIVMGAVAIKH